MISGNLVCFSVIADGMVVPEIYFSASLRDPGGWTHGRICCFGQEVWKWDQESRDGIN